MPSHTEVRTGSGGAGRVADFRGALRFNGFVRSGMEWLSGSLRNSVQILPPQPKYTAFSSTYAPTSGAAFAFEPTVEALWKQEGPKSFEAKRKLRWLLHIGRYDRRHHDLGC